MVGVQRSVAGEIRPARESREVMAGVLPEMTAVVASAVTAGEVAEPVAGEDSGPRSSAMRVV